MDIQLDSYKYLTLECRRENIKIRDFLSEAGLSSRLIRRSIREGHILLNGVYIYKNAKLEIGDKISIYFPDEDYSALPEKGNINIVYEDEDLLVVSKEVDQVVHNTSGHLEGTLSNYIAGYFSEKGIKRKVRLVNRLDRDTTGLLIIAKNSFAHQQLAKQMEEDTIIKKYKTLCKGGFKVSEGILEFPIIRGEDGIRREVDFEKGSYSKTGYKVLEDKGSIALVELRLYTGRTHQIRVHLSHIGHPIVGDELYGGDNSFNRQLLHSYYMEIKHPRTGESLVLEDKLHRDFEALLEEAEILA